MIVFPLVCGLHLLVYEAYGTNPPDRRKFQSDPGFDILVKMVDNNVLHNPNHPRCRSPRSLTGCLSFLHGAVALTTTDKVASMDKRALLTSTHTPHVHPALSVHINTYTPHVDSALSVQGDDISVIY